MEAAVLFVSLSEDLEERCTKAGDKHTETNTHNWNWVSAEKGLNMSSR